MLEITELTPDKWAALETLFSTNGACGGCWCMSWRTPKGEKWASIKGEEAKKRMKALVEEGKAFGALAFEDGQAIGWCSFGPRRDYFKLDRAPSLACDDAEKVWSLPCFFIKNGFRGKKVATALLAFALERIAEKGGNIAEGYPVKPPKDGKPIPGAFAWTGTRSLFESAGFEVVGNPEGGKQRVRKTL